MFGELWRHFGKTGLIGYYRLNGNSTDESGSGKNGTDTAITYSDANGRFGNGAGFNGSSSKITFSAIIAPTSTFTFLAWVKPTSLAAAQDFLSSNAGVMAARIGADGGMGIFDYAAWSTNGVYWNFPATSCVAGKWNLLAWMYNATTDKARFIGASVDGFTDSGEVTKTVVGAGGKSGYSFTNLGGPTFAYFGGAMDEFAAFNKIITPQEIKKYWDSMKQINI